MQCVREGKLELFLQQQMTAGKRQWIKATKVCRRKNCSSPSFICSLLLQFSFILLIKIEEQLCFVPLHKGKMLKN